MAQSTRDLLNEAIADAEAVRETAIASAKLQLEESIAPTIREEISKALSEDIGNVSEAHNPHIGQNAGDFGAVGESKDSVALNTSGIGSSGNSGLTAGEDSTAPEPGKSGGAGPTPSLNTSGIGNDNESSGNDEGESPDMMPEEATIDGDELEEGIENLDLEAIIRELQSEVDAMGDTDDEMGMDFGDDEGEADMGMDYPEEDPSQEVPAAPAPDAGAGISFGDDGEEDEMEEELDFEALMAEIDAELSENDNIEVAEENKNLKNELTEYRKAVEVLRTKLNEVNLLNAKLLFTNKLFKGRELTSEQKSHVIDTFDLATTIREVKLVYTTLLSEVNVPRGRKSQTRTNKVVTEAIASSVVGSTAPTTEVTEERDVQLNEAVTRMQKLAGIKVL
jgi:hypothetical protein